MSERAREILIAGERAREVLQPRSLQELQDIVRAADGQGLVPVGGGLHLGLGGAVRGPWSAVRLRDALTGTISHQEDDLTVVAPAGATLGEVNAVLAQRGQRLPLDPPLAENATLGGVLATNLGGPMRSRFGLPRDLVLGMTTLRADGELVRAGGRVVKNVTGYDLMRLWCGSLGTLGIITEVALRVYPAVPTVTLKAPVEDVPGGIAAVDCAYRADLRPELADIVERRGKASLLLRVPEPAAASAGRLLGAHAVEPQEADRAYRSIRDMGYEASPGLVIQVAAPPSKLAWATDVLRPLAPSTLVVRPLVPLVRAAWTADALPPAHNAASTVAAIRAALAGGLGSATVETMPAAWQGSLDPWGTPRSGLAIMQRLKGAYDPAGRFNPGRFAGGI